MKTLLLICTFVGFSLIVNAQKAYYVRQDGIGTGISWDDASGDLQAMINKASERDSIFVAAGKYLPGRPADQVTLGTAAFDNPDNAFVLKKGVKIYGGFPATGHPVFASRSWKDNETTLSGDIGTEDDNSDNVYHVVISVNDDKNTVLDGFTITGGAARDATPYHTITVEGKEIGTSWGAGMYTISSSPAISNIIFSSNLAQGWGGGLYNASASSPDVSSCTFSENGAQNGGGMFNNTSSSPNISHSVFNKNSVNNSGGGMANELSSSPKISYCTFSGNFANKTGGALSNYSHSSPQITNSLIINNSSYGSLNSVVVSGGGGGAAIASNNPDVPGYHTAFSGGSKSH